MPYIEQEKLQRLIQDVNILDVVNYLGIACHKKGSNYFLLCPSPEHNDTHATNCYCKDGGTRVVCKACGYFASPIELVKDVTRMSFFDAVNVVWEIAGCPSYLYEMEPEKKCSFYLTYTTYPVVPLSDICEINAENKNPTLAFGDDEFIYIDISSVENGTGKVDFSNKIKGTDAPSRAKRALKKGDILFSTVRPNLKAYGYVEREDCDCCVAYTGFAVISAKSMVLSKYVYYMLYSEPVQTQLSSMMGKGAYTSVNQKDVSQIQIPLPSLSIQEDFVAELDSYQKIIDGARQVVENYKPSIPISSSWEVIPLRNLCENLDSKRIPITSSNRGTGDVPCYGASGIVDYVKDYIFDEPLLLISEDGANLLTRSTPIAFSISGKTWVSNHAHVLKFNNIYTQRFVEFYINQVDISQYITGAAQPKLSQANLNKICIPCPNIEVQEKIVKEIESVIHIVGQNKRLIAIFEQKMADKISEIWGEKQ